ncbi:hypothetical protein VKT23_001299 [Stygiomarasmius scandens]|uniref:Uncharacterized protein n=1 Tax=Marasmiellus scandens TaxID=2682957 RepID=A0ABR1K6P2_9AGAR
MSSIVPPQASPLQGFSFSTIGKPPELLKRISSAPDSSAQHESRSPSPPIQVKDNSQSRTSNSRFLQALTQGATPEIQMQDSTPARRAQIDIFGRRMDSARTTPSQPRSAQVVQSSISAPSSSSISSTVHIQSEDPVPAQNEAGPSSSALNDELMYPSVDQASDIAPYTSAYSEMRDIHARLLQLQSSVDAATTSSGNELSTALDKSRDAYTLAETSLSSTREASKALQASLVASQGAFESATQAHQLVQDAIKVFGKKEEQWKKVCFDMKIDLLKLGECIAKQENREFEKFEQQKQREKEEKERQAREKEEKEKAEKIHQLQEMIEDLQRKKKEIEGSTREELEREKQRLAEEQEQKRLEEIQKQAEEEKRRQSAAERQRRAMEEERKRKAAALETERKRLAEEEEQRRRAEQTLREQVIRRKAEQAEIRRKSASAEQEGRKVTPPNPEIQPPPPTSSTPLSSSRAAKSTAPVSVPPEPVSAQPVRLSPTLPPKPNFTAPSDPISSLDSTKGQPKKKGKQKATKGTSGEVRLGPSSTSPELHSDHIRAAASAPGPSESGSVRTAASGPQRSHVQIVGNSPTSQRSPVTADLANNLPNEILKPSPSSVDTSRPVKKETNATVSLKVKKEQVDEDRRILQHAGPASSVSQQINPPTSPPRVVALPLAINASSQSTAQAQVSRPIPVAPVSTTADANSSTLPQKRKRPVNTNQSQPDPSSEPTKVPKRNQPRRTPTKATSESTSILPASEPPQIPSTPIAAAPTSSDAYNSHDEHSDPLRHSPMGPDMLATGGWNNTDNTDNNPVINNEPPRRLVPSARNTRGGGRAPNHGTRTYDHYSPPSPGGYRSPRTPERSRSRSPYWQRRSHSPPYESDRYHSPEPRYNRWERRSPSPPPRPYSPRERNSYIPSKRVHEAEPDPYPNRRLYHERSPSPYLHQQNGGLEARLSGAGERRSSERPALLRRLRNSNEPSDPPPFRGRGNGRGRGRGHGHGHVPGNRGGGRLARRIQSESSSSNNLFDRLQADAGDPY